MNPNPLRRARRKYCVKKKPYFHLDQAMRAAQELDQAYPVRHTWYWCPYGEHLHVTTERRTDGPAHEAG